MAKSKKVRCLQSTPSPRTRGRTALAQGQERDRFAGDAGTRTADRYHPPNKHPGRKSTQRPAGHQQDVHELRQTFSQGKQSQTGCENAAVVEVGSVTATTSNECGTEAGKSTEPQPRLRLSRSVAVRRFRTPCLDLEFPNDLTPAGRSRFTDRGFLIRIAAQSSQSFQQSTTCRPRRRVAS